MPQEITRPEVLEIQHAGYRAYLSGQSPKDNPHKRESEESIQRQEAWFAATPPQKPTVPAPTGKPQARANPADKQTYRGVTHCVNTATGTFWIEGRPQRVTGEFVISDDQFFMLKLKQFLVVPQQVTRNGNGFAYSVKPEHIVADYEPVAIYGELTDSTPVCLLEAHMEHGPAIGMHLQEYTGQ